jgi:hypothetical protein
VRSRLGRDLQHGLHELGLDLSVLRIPEQGLDGVDEVVGLPVDDHELLLDAEGVGGPPEVVLHAAAGYPAPLIHSGASIADL